MGIARLSASRHSKAILELGGCHASAALTLRQSLGQSPAALAVEPQPINVIHAYLPNVLLSCPPELDVARLASEITMNTGTIARFRAPAISPMVFGAVLVLGGNGVFSLPAAEPAKDEKAGGKGPMVQSPLAEKWDYGAAMKKVA